METELSSSEPHLSKPVDQSPEGGESDHIPIDMEPCEMRAWMDSHLSWALSLPETMTPEEIRSLYRRHIESACPVRELLGEIASDPNTPPDVLADLAHPRWRILHWELADNPALPAELFQRLARSRQGRVLVHLTWNRNTPVEIVERIARRARQKYAREAAQERLGERKSL